MTTTSKRPEQVAWVSLIVSVVFFAISFFLGRWSGYFAVSAIGWHVLGAALIWLVLAIQFHQRSLAEQEKLDMSQLAEDRGGSELFQGKGERAVLLAAAQRRLELLEKWFVPIFGGLIAAYEITLGILLLRSIGGDAAETQQPLVCAIVMTAIAFIGFLVSRYATGMSAEERWKPLRAGGSYLLGVALLCFAAALSLAGLHFHFMIPIKIVSYVIPSLMLLLGAETALNTVFDIYRPRIKGQYNRTAFDSRLLGIINEPGGIFRSAAAAIDYQFGFKVSETWFYRLLERAIVSLVLFSAVTLYLASCIVVVSPNEEAIVERFGNPLTDSNDVRSVGPGLHVKLPWPIDIAYKHPTDKVMELYVGYVPKRNPKTGEIIPDRVLLWGQTHYEKESSVLAATEYTGDDQGEGAIPVSLVNANMPVQYRIKDLYAYVYGHEDPAGLLEAICYRELTNFASSARVEVDGIGTGAVANDSLFGAGRTRAKNVLTERIQKAADDQGLGIEVVFLGMQGLHPPPEVAADYQAVVGAVQTKQALVLQAEALRNRSLSTLVGSVTKANELADLAVQYQDAQSAGRAEDVERLGKEFDAAFAEARGAIYKTIEDARSQAFAKATLAKATGERFAGQLQAYRAAPEIYMRQERLAVLEKALADIRKYVVVAEPNDTEVIILDLQQELSPDVWEIGGIQQESSR